MWRLTVVLLDALQNLVLAADLNLIDQLVRAGREQWQGNQLPVAIAKDVVPVDPATLDEVDVVVNYERIYRVHELEIAQVWE